MQERINPSPKATGPLGIRASVWFIVCGSLLACLLLISVSRHQAGPSAIQPESASERATRNEAALVPSSIRPIHRTAPAATFSEVPMQSTWSQASPAVSNELNLAREKLTGLRRDYSDEHPEVKEQLRAIESMERSAVTPGETLELAKARADLARLEVRFGPQHPDLQAQLRFVESLEHSAAANEPSDLAQAKAQLAKLRVLYGEGHPEVQGQLKKVAEAQR